MDAFLVSRPPQSALLHCQAPILLLSRWLACLTGSSILVLKLTSSPDPLTRNLPLSLTDWFHGFYPTRVGLRKSLALEILVSAAFWAHFNIDTYLLTYYSTAEVHDPWHLVGEGWSTNCTNSPLPHSWCSKFCSSASSKTSKTTEKCPNRKNSENAKVTHGDLWASLGSTSLSISG